MKKVLFLLLVFSIVLSLNAELNRLRIVGQAEHRPNAIVQARYQTVNRERAACLIFVTDLDVDLDFRPRVELVALTNPAPGQHHVYVAPDERVVTVHALGYAPLIVVLRDFGISVLRSGEVYELQLTGDEPRRRDDVDLYISFDILSYSITTYADFTGYTTDAISISNMSDNYLLFALHTNHPPSSYLDWI